MKTYSLMLNLGGDAGNQVPKHQCTVAEVILLQAIHGEDAVNEIEEDGDSNISNRDERQRLDAIYGRAVNADQKKHIEVLFPGIAARLPDDIRDVELADIQFKADRKKGRRKVEAGAEADADEDEDEDDDDVDNDAPSDARAVAKVAKDTGAKKPRKPRSTKSSATDTGLKGQADGPNAAPPTGKGGAGSLGSKGGVDGQGTLPVPAASEKNEDGVKDMPSITD